MVTTNYQYASVLRTILTFGKEIQSRNAKTIRDVGLRCKFSTSPLVSVRRTAWKSALREMEWFLSGSNNINDLHESVQKWWKPWADKDGLIEHNYSKQFRQFHGQDGHMDQIDFVIKTLKNKPFSRRNVITTWNSSDMISAPITNCHGTVIQFFVDPDKSLHMLMYQRSCDMIVGVPHNWIQYWAFLQYLASVTDLHVGTFQWIGGDCHIYEEHVDLAREIVDKIFKGKDTYTPELVYNSTGDEFKSTDFSLDGKYEPLIRKSARMVV